MNQNSGGSCSNIGFTTVAPCHNFPSEDLGWHNINISTCAEENAPPGCENNQLQNYTAEIVEGVELVGELLILIDDILELLSCDYIGALFTSLKDALCKEMKGGIFQISVSAGLLATTSIPLTLLMIMGNKRFTSDAAPDDIELRQPI